MARRSSGSRRSSGTAMRDGLVLALLTDSGTLAGDPQVAVELCRPSRAWVSTLDPSHVLQGPHKEVEFDAVYPYVQNVHLRDTGKRPASSRSASARVRSNTPGSSPCSSDTATSAR